MNQTHIMHRTSLVDQCAIVTGATSGIGLGIARALASVGADVLINGLGTPAGIRKAVDLLNDAGSGRIVYFDADMTKVEQIEEDVMLGAQPTGRFVQIDELASLVLFLCSDGASSITGTILPVDGGWCAQ